MLTPMRTLWAWFPVSGCLINSDIFLLFCAILIFLFKFSLPNFSPSQCPNTDFFVSGVVKVFERKSWRRENLLTCCIYLVLVKKQVIFFPFRTSVFFLLTSSKTKWIKKRLFFLSFSPAQRLLSTVNKCCCIWWVCKIFLTPVVLELLL